VLPAMWGAYLCHVALRGRRYRSYWAATVVVGAATVGTPFRYVEMGDSAAQGIGASDPQHGYVSLEAAGRGRWVSASQRASGGLGAAPERSSGPARSATVT